MPRFALLLHRMPAEADRPDHWDLLLEQGDSCRTWAVESEPIRRAASIAEQLADHRLLYLDYEGPISGGRGTVEQVDAGEFQWLVDEPQRVEISLAGEQLRGTIVLTRDQVESKSWSYLYRETAAG